jgi:hypothetical protein
VRATLRIDTTAAAVDTVAAIHFPAMENRGFGVGGI